MFPFPDIQWHKLLGVWPGAPVFCPRCGWFLLEQSNSNRHLFSAADEWRGCIPGVPWGDTVLLPPGTRHPLSFSLLEIVLSTLSPHFCLGSLPALNRIQSQCFAPGLFLLETFLGFAHRCLYTIRFLSLTGMNQVQTKQSKCHSSRLNPRWFAIVTHYKTLFERVPIYSWYAVCWSGARRRRNI